MKYWNAGIKKFPRAIIKATEFHKKLDNCLTVS